MDDALKQRAEEAETLQRIKIAMKRWVRHCFAIEEKQAQFREAHQLQYNVAIEKSESLETSLREYVESFGARLVQGRVRAPSGDRPQGEGLLASSGSPPSDLGAASPPAEIPGSPTQPKRHLVVPQTPGITLSQMASTGPGPAPPGQLRPVPATPAFVQGAAAPGTPAPGMPPPRRIPRENMKPLLIVFNAAAFENFIAVHPDVVDPQDHLVIEFIRDYVDRIDAESTSVKVWKEAMKKQFGELRSARMARSKSFLTHFIKMKTQAFNNPKAKAKAKMEGELARKAGGRNLQDLQVDPRCVLLRSSRDCGKEDVEWTVSILAPMGFKEDGDLVIQPPVTLALPILRGMRTLETWEGLAELLLVTQAGKVINSLRRHRNKEVAELARDVHGRLKEASKRTEAKRRGVWVSLPPAATPAQEPANGSPGEVPAEGSPDSEFHQNEKKEGSVEQASVEQQDVKATAEEGGKPEEEAPKEGPEAKAKDPPEEPEGEPETGS